MQRLYHLILVVLSAVGMCARADDDGRTEATGNIWQPERISDIYVAKGNNTTSSLKFGFEFVYFEQN